MATTFFAYAKCSTCRKAAKWLEGRKIAVAARPIVEKPPTVAELKSMVARSGLPLAKFFNTSGESYRALDKAALAQATDAEKLAWLAADGKLIKRPILDDGTTVLVGFDEAKYEAWARG